MLSELTLLQEMLSEALDKKYESGSEIQYLCQDMTELDMYGTIDVTVSVLDSINHLADVESIRKTFERVSLFAFPDGLFIFDMNTVYKHREILGNNSYVVFWTVFSVHGRMNIHLKMIL